MINNQHFDEYIKEEFSNFSPDVHQRIWENIAAKKEKRKPAGFWISFFNSRNILILLGLLIAGGSGGYLLFKNPSLPRTEKNIKPALTENNNHSNSLPVTTSGNNNKEPEPINITGPDLPSPAPNENKGPDTFNGRRSNSVKTFSPSNIRVISSTGQIENEATPVNNRNGRISGADRYVNNDDYSAGGSLFGRLLYDTHQLSAKRSTNSELQKRKVPNWFLPDCPSMEKDAAGNKKYFEIYGGPDFAIRKMSDTGNSMYLQKRKESTKFSSAYSAGISYTRVFSNSMSLKAGVNFSQINEKFTYVQGNLVQITYIINANGDTTGSYITRGTRYKTTHNKYRSVDVPLMVGYEVGNGKIHANISAGAVVNIYSWQKGELLDTSYNPVNITTGKNASPYQFKTNAGIGFITSASVFYKLNEKLHVLAEPYFRYNFSPLNKDNLTLKQKYSTVGLRLGIRVDLK